MGGKVSSSVGPVGGSPSEVRVALSSIYSKPSICEITKLPDDVPFPNNVFLRQRISQAEWKDFCSSIRSSLHKAEPPDFIICIMILALTVLTFFMELGYIILIVSCLFFGWYHLYRRRSWINALYSGLALYNKYLFRQRGLQLRLQIKCERRPISTSSVATNDLYIRIDIAHPATRASVLSQYEDIRLVSRNLLRSKSAASEGFIDFYEKKESKSIICIPAVDALLDESKVDDDGLRRKYMPSETPRRGSHAAVPVVTALQVGESPAPVGSPIYIAYPYSGMAVVYGNEDHDRYSSLISSGYAGVIAPSIHTASAQSGNGIGDSLADSSLTSSAVSAATGLMTLTMPQVIEEGLVTPDPRGTDRSSTLVGLGTGGSRHGSRSASAVMPYSSDTDEDDMV